MLKILFFYFLLAAASAQGNFGEYCQLHSECAAELNCVNYACSCPSPSSQVFVNGVCAGLVGTPCDAQNQCVETAMCNNSTNTCDCLPNYIDSTDGNCIKSLGAACTNDQECAASALYCIKGKCGCNDLVKVFEFQNYQPTCAIGAGNRCSYYHPCVNNAQCISTGNERTSKCVCNNGFTRDAATKRCIAN